MAKITPDKSTFTTMLTFTTQLASLVLVPLVDISDTVDSRPSAQMIQSNPSHCETTSNPKRKR